MSATSTYYNFTIQKAAAAGSGSPTRCDSGASPQTRPTLKCGSRVGPRCSLEATTTTTTSSGTATGQIHRRRQATGSPSCSSIATTNSSSSSINSTSNSSLNGAGFGSVNLVGLAPHANICNFNSGAGGGSMVSPPISLASPCSSSSSTSSSSSSSNGSSSSRNHTTRDLIRQASLMTQTTQSSNLEQIPMNHHRSPQLFHSHTLHSLEPKPLKPYKSNSEYLEAMKEDLAEWFNSLYSDLELSPENLFQHLETGAIICRHANNVTQMGRNSMLEQHQNDSCQPNQETTLISEARNNEPNNNSNNIIMSSRSPSISSSSSLSSPNDSLQYQSHYNQHSSLKSPLSLNSNNGGNSLMMISSNGNNTNSPRQQDYGNHANQNKTINWFQIKMIPYKQDALPGTFLARDNICQFILWCRSLNILECLLFETDDLVARKNEKSFILCLLEVARIGFKVGMPTPLIIQLEQEIDREIENDAKRQKQRSREEEDEKNEKEKEREKLNQDEGSNTIGSGDSCLVANEREDCDSDGLNELDNGGAYKNDENVVGLDCEAKTSEEKQVVEDDERRRGDHEDAVEEQEQEPEEELDFGPKPQVITNDLLSLHEKVVQLLCLCTCPTQFPMVRVGENGKYKVGDKLIIFVRILRRHIMVRVGGGWQELSEFLRVKDPCRSKSPPNHHNHNNHHHHNQTQQTNHAGLYNLNGIHHQLQNINANGNNTNNHDQHHQHHHHHHQSLLPKLVSSSRSRLGESSHHLNKGHLANQSYRNNGGQRHLISGSASMSWLSHNS